MNLATGVSHRHFVSMLTSAWHQPVIPDIGDHVPHCIHRDIVIRNQTFAIVEKVVLVFLTLVRQ